MKRETYNLTSNLGTKKKKVQLWPCKLKSKDEIPVNENY